MARIYATRSAVVTVGGQIITVHRGEEFDDADDIVREHPSVFVNDVEDATAVPGAKRGSRS